jgi:hypothetical protein
MMIQGAAVFSDEEVVTAARCINRMQLATEHTVLRTLAYSEVRCRLLSRIVREWATALLQGALKCRDPKFPRNFASPFN